MKKIVSVLTVVLLMLSAVLTFVACTPREQILKIRNWGEYMPKEVYKNFETWYEEQTGTKVTVQYSEFSTNEDLYKEIVNGKDYDLICPSDYMIERMVKENLLQPLDQTTQELVNSVVDNNLKSLVLNAYESKPVTNDGTKLVYSMPYMWGTMGIMYNSKTAGYNDEMMSKWDVLWDSNNSKKIYMKDSVRDSYSISLLRENADKLLQLSNNGTNYNNQEYQTLLNGIFSQCTTDTISTAEKALVAQRSILRGYEVDSAKTEMQADINGDKGYYGVFWSCDAGYIMNGDEESGANRNLRYIVPTEGSNVWVDGFVINKNAVNTKAANMFIQYLCQADVAYECMDYVGSTSGVKEAVDNYKADIQANPQEWFGDDNISQEFLTMYYEMMFPTQQTLLRCGIMRDFGEGNDLLNEMWIRVRV